MPSRKIPYLTDFDKTPKFWYPRVARVAWIDFSSRTVELRLSECRENLPLLFLSPFSLSLSLSIRFLFLLFCLLSFSLSLYLFFFSPSTELPLSWFVPILFPFSNFLIFLPFLFSFIFSFLSFFSFFFLFSSLSI